MICPKCGAEVQENQLFCPNCDASLSTAAFEQPDLNVQATDNYTANQPQQSAPSYQYQDPDGQQYAQNQYSNGQQPYYVNAPLNNAPEMPMKWFKFLIYFSLFAGAVLNVINAIRYFTGTIYGSSSEAEAVYRYFDGLKGLDIFYGFLLLIMAALAIAARFALSGFKKNGPMMLYILYGADILITLIYFLVLAGIVSSDVLSSVATSYIGNVVISAVVLGLNVVYFNKRKHLFVN